MFNILILNIKGVYLTTYYGRRNIYLFLAYFFCITHLTIYVRDKYFNMMHFKNYIFIKFQKDPTTYGSEKNLI